MQNEEIDESDCCGNGCVNCILDLKTKLNEKIIKTNKINVISRYSSFKLLSKTPHTSKLKDKCLELHFGYAEEKKEENCDYILDIPLGQHVMMRAVVPKRNDNKIFEWWLRPYSPFWVNETLLEFKILVKLNPQGPMSQYISNMYVNDEVDIRGPIGGTFADRYAIDNGILLKHIIIITQGVAIAPTIPIIEALLQNEEEMSRITHLACFRNFDHIYFRHFLQRFNSYWNYKSRIYLSHEQCDSELCQERCSEKCDHFVKQLKYKEQVFSRKLNELEIGEICNIGGGLLNVFIICGSNEFQNFMVESIRISEIDVSEENVHLF